MIQFQSFGQEMARSEEQSSLSLMSPTNQMPEHKNLPQNSQHLAILPNVGYFVKCWLFCPKSKITQPLNLVAMVAQQGRPLSNWACARPALELLVWVSNCGGLPQGQLVGMGGAARHDNSAARTKNTAFFLAFLNDLSADLWEIFVLWLLLCRRFQSSHLLPACPQDS